LELLVMLAGRNEEGQAYEHLSGDDEWKQIGSDSDGEAERDRSGKCVYMSEDGVSRLMIGIIGIGLESGNPPEIRVGVHGIEKQFVHLLARHGDRASIDKRRRRDDNRQHRIPFGRPATVDM